MSKFLSKTDALYALEDGVRVGGRTSGRTASDALVNQSREERRAYDELTPLRVVCGGRLGGDRLVEGTTLLLEFLDVLVDGEKHVAIGRKLCLVAHRLAIDGEHDCSLSRFSE